MDEVFKVIQKLLVVNMPVKVLRGLRIVARLRRDLAKEHGDPDVNRWRIAALHLGQLIEARVERGAKA